MIIRAAVLMAVLLAAGAAASREVPEVGQLLSLDDGRLLVLSNAGPGLFVSSDGGRRWRPARGVPDSVFYAMAPDGRGNVLLTTAHGLYRSMGDPGTWGLVFQGAVRRAVCGPDGRECLLAVWGKGLFAAREARDLAPVRPGPVSKVDPMDLAADALRIEAGLPAVRPEGDMAERDDAIDRNRSLWEEAGAGLPERPIQDLAVDRKGRWLAGFFGEGVWRSTDHGASWQSFNEGLTARQVLFLAAGPAGGLLAGTYGGGLFARPEDGSSWSPVDVKGIAQAAAFGPSGEALAASREGGLFLSDAALDAWRPLAAPGLDIRSLAVGPGGAYWAGVAGQGLFRSEDRGLTWQARPFAYTTDVGRVAVGPDGGWFVLSSGLGLFRSDDRGGSWAFVPLPVAPDRRLFMAFSDDGWLHLGGREKGYWVSDDRGRHWAAVVDPLFKKGLQCLCRAPDGTLLAVPGERRGLFRRTADGGWEKIATDPDYPENPYSVWDMLFLPDGRAVASGAYDVLVSRPGDAPWFRSYVAQRSRGLHADRAGTLISRRQVSTLALLPGERNWIGAPDPLPDLYGAFARAGDDFWMGARGAGGLDLLAARGGRLEVVRHCLEKRKVLAMAADGDGALLVGTADGFWFSTDRGATWSTAELEDWGETIRPGSPGE